MHALLQPMPDDAAARIQELLFEHQRPAGCSLVWGGARAGGKTLAAQRFNEAARAAGIRVQSFDRPNPAQPAEPPVPCLGGCGRMATDVQPFCCTPCRNGASGHTAGCNERSGR